MNNQDIKEKQSKKIYILYRGKDPGDIKGSVQERFPGATIEESIKFKFSPGVLIECRKKISKPHDITVIQISPPLNYFKKLVLYFLLLFIPSKEKIIIEAEGSEPVYVRWYDGFTLALIFPFAVLLTLFIEFSALIYTFLAGIYLLVKGDSNCKSDPDNKKVVYLAPSRHLLDPYRGSTSHARGVIRAFQETGWDIVVVSPGNIPGISGEYEIIKPALQNLLTGGVSDILYDFIYFLKALPLVKKKKPAFIYQRHGRYSMSGVLISRITGIPLALEMNAVLSYESGKWGGTGAVMRMFISRYENICIKHAGRIFTVSELLKKDIISAGGSPERVFVNPNGVDVNVFHPGCGGDEIRKKHGLENKVVVGFCGSFYPWHGVDFLTEVIQKTISTDKNISFLLVGGGPEREKMELNTGNNDASNSNNTTIFTGRVNPGEVPAYLDACDILLLTISRGFEYSSPIKLFEYMAMSKAIICPEVGQMGEILDDGVDAVLICPEDVDAFYKAIDDLVENEQKRRDLGIAARKKATEKYTWKANVERVVQSMFSIYGG
ncbi:MAG: glycosyltransferase family 4 protein [Candidatus Eremiobacteraeota bacterium]|nr:glycosyltransferase family 4 protein [Candidatus Eremiobacteraeota bacterium]